MTVIAVHVMVVVMTQRYRVVPMTDTVTVIAVRVLVVVMTQRHSVVAGTEALWLRPSSWTVSCNGCLLTQMCCRCVVSRPRSDVMSVCALSVSGKLSSV